MCAVEWKSLEELGVFYGGLSGKSKDDFQDGNAKFVTYMNVYSNMSLDFTIADMVKVGEYEKQNSIKYGDILFTGSSETPDDCGMSCVVTCQINEPIYLNSFCFGFRFIDMDQFEPEFLKHYFRCISLRKAIASTASGVTRFNVSKKRFGKIQIPLLTFNDQKIIAKQLDTFTTLISNLESELDMRRKQYENYRNQLLDFEGVEGVEWRELGKLVKRNKGISITAGQMSELNIKNGNVRVFAAGQTIADINEDNLPANCAYNLPSIIVKSRGYIDFEFYDKPFTHKNEMWSYSFVNKDLGKLIYYYLTAKTDYFRNKAKANSVKLPQLCVADTDNYLIPIPAFATQQQIVEKLDAFEQLIQSLETEIKLRKQQYEYYREKLLTFD